MKAALVLSCLIAICMAGVQDDMLERHNRDRRRHGSVDLTTNDDLVEIAQICADRSAKRDKIKHDCPQSQEYGENLAWSMNSRGSPDDEKAVQKAYDGWYGERKDYDYSSGQSTGGPVGHFTQIVWNSTLEVGCAAAKNERKKSAVVACVYNPPGNYEGEETKNVAPPNDK